MLVMVLIFITTPIAFIINLYLSLFSSRNGIGNGNGIWVDWIIIIIIIIV
jgi:hypothetical protein